MGRIRQDWGIYPRRYQKNGKAYTVWWYYIYAPDGTRYRLSTEKSTKQEAHNEVNRRLAEGTALPTSVLDDSLGPTVEEMGRRIWDWDGDYIQGILLRGRITPGYVQESLARFVRYIVPALGQRRIRTVTVADLEPVFSKLAGGLRNKTINHIYHSAKGVWDEAFRLEIIEKNPFHRMKPYESRSQGTEIFELEDALAILDRRWWRDDVTWAINLAGATTGARVAELAALKIGKVLEDRLRIESTIRGIITDSDGEKRLELGVVEGTKTYELGNRWVAIPPFVRKALEVVIAGRGTEEFVFRSEIGTINQYTVGRARRYSGDHIGLEVPVKQLKAAIERVNASRQEQAALAGAEADLLPLVTFQAWRHLVTSLLSPLVSDDSKELHLGHAIKGTKGEYLHQTEAHVQEVLGAQKKIFRALEL